MNANKNNKIFKPANWSQARKEITEDNFYLSREYYMLEREKNHSDWLKSKKKWMGIPFIASRKTMKDEIPKCKKVGQLGKSQYTNNNRYQTFEVSLNPRRSHILSNFKQITKIINKAFIKI